MKTLKAFQIGIALAASLALELPTSQSAKAASVSSLTDWSVNGASSVLGDSLTDSGTNHPTLLSRKCRKNDEGEEDCPRRRSGEARDTNNPGQTEEADFNLATTV
ncbi:hypothetical protein [Kamptonema formosum]|uniref:hypothetical protein n=1 Tax=Kamptonema formosum TaxID=331992 RepID=UPI000345024D|nr:hypothetical protein [Oscillatoria sp. PCC 10802]